MSRLLTQEEIEALLAGGPMVPASPERPHLAIGDFVDIVSDGVIVAHGEIVLVDGRFSVRIVASAKQRSTTGGSVR
jgi:hypothetical protein